MKNNREHILKGIGKPEDRLAAAKLLDKSELSRRTNKPVHSDFLDPRQQKLAEGLMKSAGITSISFYGGYEEAERSVALFIPEMLQDDELEEYKKGIMKVIEITPPSRNSLTHRDYLGALMGLGIRRDVTGDIVISDEKCSIIVLNDIADYIAGNLTRVGNIGVSLKISDIIESCLPSNKGTELKAVVSALRLDCICASAFGLSRSKAAEYIKSGKVQLEWEITQSTDKTVKEGDTLSLRGRGRAVLDKVGGRTKKDRINIIIRKYV